MSTNHSLVGLVSDALAEFAHSECPYCQAYIGLDRYVDNNDIEKWLVSQLQKGVGGGE